MMKKRSQTLLLVLGSLALLVSVTASAHAQRYPGGRPLTYTVSGTIRWKKEFGVVPMGPGNKQAAVYPCTAFYVAALDPSSGKAITYTDGLLTQEPDEGEYHVCRYSLKIPPDRQLRIFAGMGGVLLLPKVDPSPMYLTDPWIGGSQSRPPRGASRLLTGSKYATLSGRRTRALVSFELIYALPRSDDPR